MAWQKRDEKGRVCVCVCMRGIGLSGSRGIGVNRRGASEEDKCGRRDAARHLLVKERKVDKTKKKRKNRTRAEPRKKERGEEEGIKGGLRREGERGGGTYTFGTFELCELACTVDFEPRTEDFDFVSVHGWNIQ